MRTEKITAALRICVSWPDQRAEWPNSTKLAQQDTVWLGRNVQGNLFARMRLSTRSETRSGTPLTTVSVRVLSGPDQGRHHLADVDSLAIGTAADNDLVLTDDTVSRYHLQLKISGDRVSVSDLGSTNGTFLGAARIDRASVLPRTSLTIGQTEIIVEHGGTSSVELYDADQIGSLLGRTNVMRRLMTQIERVAASDVSILLFGETGTGKEVVARAIRQMSPRANGPFETVDCGSLLSSLIASELFGHEKGAFTGATQQHTGAFERAHGGTLFLDEIGELPEALQANLLGALERRSFRRIGGKNPIGVDVRVISATNRDLRREVNSGLFRLDLYYRIAVLVLELPALRDRAEDIPLLLEHFLRESGYQDDIGAIIPPHVMRSLETHRWPGNIRELRNFAEAALALGSAPHLETASQGTSAPIAFGELLEIPYNDARARLLLQFEREYLDQLLLRENGNVSAASRNAKMNRSHLSQLMKRHGLR